MWYRLMMAAFVFNGLCTFGLRILEGLGLATRYTSDYLVAWYVSGAAFVLVLALRAWRRPTAADLWVGCGLGLCSACGQTSLGLALAHGLPGHIVFPVTLAGGLFLVVAAGILVFKERIGPAGVAGVLLGIASVVLLGLG